MAVGALILIGACSGSDAVYWTGSIEMDSNGLAIRIDLSKPVNLPLDRPDATLIMRECGCPCQGDLEYVHGYWQYQGQDCLIRIEAATGYVYCQTNG